MMWLYILMDVVIIVAIVFLCVLAAYFWTKHKPLSKNSLTEFRNDDIYEKSIQDKKRLAHIEDAVEQPELCEYDELIEDADLSIGVDNITFSSGYGGPTEEDET